MTIDTISLLLNSAGLQRWEFRALRELVTAHEARVSLVVIKDRTQESLLDRVRTLRQEGAWGLYSVVRELGSTPDYRESIALHDTGLCEESEVVTCSPIPSESFGERLPSDIVAKAAETDLTIRFGFGILQGDILTASKYGVLSYHHGDLRRYRGRPAGFWELRHGESHVGITVQRLTETLDGGEIAAFHEIDISDTTSFTEVQRRLFEASPPLLPKAADSLVEETTSTPTKLGELYHRPTARDIIRVFGRSLFRRH